MTEKSAEACASDVIRFQNNKGREFAQIFAGKTFWVYDIFRLPDGCKYVDVERWIEAHGGHIRHEASQDLDYLICGIQEYQMILETVEKERAEQLGSVNNNGKGAIGLTEVSCDAGDKSQVVLKAKEKSNVQQSRALEPSCKIVTYDYIEDCLLAETPALLPYEQYQPETIKIRLEKLVEGEARLRKEFALDGVSFAKLADPDKYHIYYDAYDFAHKIVLERWITNDKVIGGWEYQDYQLFLLESNAGPPRTYLFGAIWVRSYTTHTYMDHCLGREFCDAWARFKDFFRAQTDIEWDRRLDGLASDHPRAFQYVAPDAGKPIGVMPVGWVKPGTRVKRIYTQYKKDQDAGTHDDLDFFAQCKAFEDTFTPVIDNSFKDNGWQ